MGVPTRDLLAQGYRATALPSLLHNPHSVNFSIVTLVILKITIKSSKNNSNTFSPPSCESLSCVQAGTWYWLGKDGVKINLETSQLSGVSALTANAGVACIRTLLAGTAFTFNDQSCTNNYKTICEIEDGEIISYTRGGQREAREPKVARLDFLNG